MLLNKASRLLKKLTRPSPVLFTDEFLDRLLCTNAGMLHPGNIHCFNHAIQNLNDDLYVLEIGSFCGLSANVMTYLLDRSNKSNLMITCDCWVYEGVRDHETFKGKDRYLTHVGSNDKLGRTAYTTFVKESFKQNIRMFSGHREPYSFDMPSDAFFHQWAQQSELTDLFGKSIKTGGKIGFCYIDGNHAYDFAKRDFLNADAFLEAGGYVLLDDSEDGLPFGSAKLAKELVHHERYQLVMKNPNYLFQKLK